MCAIVVSTRSTFNSTTHRDRVPSQLIPTIAQRTGQLSINLHGKPVTLNGYKKEFVFQWVAKLGSWEPHLLKLSRKLLPVGDEVVFDLGANLVGFH